MRSEEAKQKLEQEQAVCSLYIDNAKTYIQLSTGALLLSLAFARDLLGTPQLQLLKEWPLLVTWLCWLTAIPLGVTYQYCVIKYLERIAYDSKLLYHPSIGSPFLPQALIDKPGLLFGLMTLFFYVGILFFCYVAVSKFF